VKINLKILYILIYNESDRELVVQESFLSLRVDSSFGVSVSQADLFFIRVPAHYNLSQIVCPK
jgi:hypothetical protein